jgi:hypothetical protein
VYDYQKATARAPWCDHHCIQQRVRRTLSRSVLTSSLTVAAFKFVIATGNNTEIEEAVIGKTVVSWALAVSGVRHGLSVSHGE